MPKVNLNKKQYPPIDWLWAAVLERRAVMGVSLKDLAEMCHVSYGTMRNYAMKSPWAWSKDMRDTVCKSLGISVIAERTPEGVEVIVR